MKPTERQQRQRAAIEVATECLEQIGCETDNAWSNEARHMSGGSVWISLRVKVPDLNIEERIDRDNAASRKG